MDALRLQQAPPRPVPGDLPVPPAPRPDPEAPPQPVVDPVQEPPPVGDPDVTDPTTEPEAPLVAGRGPEQ